MSEIITLPSGSQESVDCLNVLNEKALNQIATRIVQGLTTKNPSPFSNADKDKISENLSLSLEQLTGLISTCTRVFQCLIYHQPKSEVIRSQLRQLSFSDGSIDVLLEVWMDKGKSAMDTLSEETCSGLPRLKDVNWSIVKSTDSSGLPFHCIQLAMDTTSGQKRVVLFPDEAKELFHTMNKIQKQIDQLLE